MQIWDLLSYEKDAVAFSQEHGVLPKLRLCGFGYCTSRNKYFGNVM